MGEDDKDSLTRELLGLRQEHRDLDAAITALEEVLKGEDPDMIRAASDALMTAVQQLASAAYEKASAAQGGSEADAESTQGSGDSEASEASEESGKDDAVDADYEVVED